MASVVTFGYSGSGPSSGPGNRPRSNPPYTGTLSSPAQRDYNQKITECLCELGKKENILGEGRSLVKGVA